MAIQSIDRKRAVTPETRSKLALLSFKMMRKWVGILGLSIGALLPLVTATVTDCGIIQESISHYYYTIAGNIFVGLLCAVSFFLIIYPGNGKWEDLWTNIAGILAIAVAFFPTSFNQLDQSCTRQGFVYDSWVSDVHLSSAAAFFIILGYVAFRQFPQKNSGDKNNKRQAARNLFYKGCGIIMWACIGILAPMVLSKSYGHYLSINKLVFALEVIALLAFGSCWLVKGFELDQAATPHSGSPAGPGVSGSQAGTDDNNFPPVRTDQWVAILALVVSIISVIFTVTSYNKSVSSQQETQAYSYWQDYLQLAIQKPLLANGDDSQYYETHRQDSSRIEYAWFVANMLGAAEMVYRLQPYDKNWAQTLKEVIGLHAVYLKEEQIDFRHYSADFVTLIDTAIRK
ncbi:hypothetical protein LZZ85_00940 [Terrimonas sp. NA20]|uniref:DUF998 domain-containing protein n=1 Tax=Terrimonas ginsenosidimutans TaxID=2908004 RepID=A0ABS9KKH5_9BACT|nr:hypothetical protein [Terrimonas ginsenosidimutans]MCG2612817.1 hypothetical protein [Terrimonas ginsenosidimutans]